MRVYVRLFALWPAQPTDAQSSLIASLEMTDAAGNTFRLDSEAAGEKRVVQGIPLSSQSSHLPGQFAGFVVQAAVSLHLCETGPVVKLA